MGAVVLCVLAALLALPQEGHGCFGARLRVGVPPEPSLALAAYAAGYYVEEKTGIAPEFVAVEGDGAAALDRGDVDLLLLPEAPPPDGIAVRPAGDVAGAGPCQFWIREDVLDDLRFFTVDRALRNIPRFYGSDAFLQAAASRDPARKAARQAVHRGN
jgi:hypothetical protein